MIIESPSPMQATNKQDISFYVSLFSLYFSVLVSFSEALNRIALYVLLPASFILTFLSYSRGSLRLAPNSYFKILLYLYAWIAFTGLFAADRFLALSQLKQLLGCLIVCFLFSVHANSLDKISLLYITYLLGYLAIFYYVINHNLSVIDIETERVGDTGFNANEFAYFTFCFTFSVYIIAEIITSRILKRLLNVAFLLTIPLSVYAALLSASRQMLFIQIPLFVILLYLRYVYGASMMRKGLFILLSIGIIYFSWTPIRARFENSYLIQRTAVSDINEESRPQLMADAISVGMTHPIVGVGPGNYILYSFRKQFSHCSYTELFANDGLLGVILYIYLLFYFFITQIKRYREYRQKLFLVFGGFGFIYIIAQFFYVYYIAQWLIGFFFLVASHSETYYRVILKDSL